MANRIPLDSPLWASTLWGGVDDPRMELEKILQATVPDPDEIESMLEGTYYVDSPSPHFYFLLPYLLDILESHPIPSVMQLFCTYLHRAKDGQPSEQCLQQLNESRHRIVALLIKSLQSGCVNEGSTYGECKWMLAGLETACNQSDLGRQIIGIDDNQHIN